MITYWPSPGKLNLFLYITGQRGDGYHTLQTLFQFINYGDTISIEERDDGEVHLLTPIDGVAAENNLITRAIDLLMCKASKVGRLSSYNGVNISVEKRLPIGGGLGAGSSNAATVLVALNHLWKCGLSQDEIIKLGFELGVDVPIFIFGRAAFAEGVGEIFTPVDPEEKWYLVVNPGINISTRVIFKDPLLARNSPVRSIDTLLECKYGNDCEPLVRKRFRKVDAAVLWLLKYAPAARITGTGACAFAEFETESAARLVLSEAPKFLQAFVVRGTNTSPLHLAILGQNAFR